MKALDYVRMVNGIFSGMLLVGLAKYLQGVTRNNVYAIIDGLILCLVSVPVVVVSTITWYLMKKDRGR